MKAVVFSSIAVALARSAGAPGTRLWILPALLLIAQAAAAEPRFEVVLSRGLLPEETAKALTEATREARPGVTRREGFTVLESERGVLYLAPRTTWLQAQRAQIEIFRALVAQADKPGFGIAVASLPPAVRRELAATASLSTFWDDPTGGKGRVDLGLQVRGTVRNGDKTFSFRVSPDRPFEEAASMAIPARNRQRGDPPATIGHLAPDSSQPLVARFCGLGYEGQARALQAAMEMLAQAEEEAERDRADAFDSLETAAWRQWRDFFGDERLRDGMPVRDSRLTNRLADQLVSAGRFTSRAEAGQWLAGASFGDLIIDVGVMMHMRTAEGIETGGYGFRRPVPQDRKPN